MRTLFTIFATALTFALLAGSGAQAQNDQKPKVVRGSLAVITATVEAVDYDARLVTLKGPAGRSVTLYVDERARNLPQVKVGDQLKAEYYESIAISVQKAGSKMPAAGESGAVSIAPAGGKPGIAAASTVVITATVKDIDHATRRVTLEGTNGVVRTITAADDVPNFEQVKAGDQVIVQHSIAVAIDVSTPQ
jgi:Cu/Ag efflux protein CusF